MFLNVNKNVHYFLKVDFSKRGKRILNSTNNTHKKTEANSCFKFINDFFFFFLTRVSARNSVLHRARLGPVLYYIRNAIAESLNLKIFEADGPGIEIFLCASWLAGGLRVVFRHERLFVQVSKTHLTFETLLTTS